MLNINDKPGNFSWLISQSDSLFIDQSNANKFYNFSWTESIDPDGDEIYSVTVSLNGPNPWHSIYAWAFKNDDLGHVEEGGGFGNGRSRARYMHQNADDNCMWEDYTFPTEKLVGEAWNKCVRIVVLENSSRILLSTSNAPLARICPMCH